MSIMTSLLHIPLSVTSSCGLVFGSLLFPSIVFHGKNHSQGLVIVPTFDSVPSAMITNSLYVNKLGISSLYVSIWSNALFTVAVADAGFLSSIIPTGNPFMKMRTSGLLLCLFSIIVNWLSAWNVFLPGL